MKKVLLLAFSVVTMVGCSTVSYLPPAPNTFALMDYPDAVSVGVAKVHDNRGSAQAGTIGGLGIKVDNNLTDFASDYLIHYLNEKMKVNVIRIRDLEDNDFSVFAQKYEVDRILLSKITELRMFSIDALLQPVETSIVIAIVVYNAEGKEVYKKSIDENYRKRVNAFIVEKSTGLLVEEAVKDAMDKLAEDSDFKTALKL